MNTQDRLDNFAVTFLKNDGDIIDKSLKPWMMASGVVTSTGDSGGIGSAGSGKQYISIIVNGIKYKILHDGTI